MTEPGQFDPRAFLKQRRERNIVCSNVAVVATSPVLKIQPKGTGGVSECGIEGVNENSFLGKEVIEADFKTRHPATTATLLQNLRDGFAHLERNCPEYVAFANWRQAVADGQQFLDTWGTQAEALGWNSVELFGLHEPPAEPHPTYSCLSRYDHKGLIWLLECARVVALTADTASIQHKSGTVSTYRKLKR
jgi:hypothetical protein